MKRMKKLMAIGLVGSMLMAGLAACGTEKEGKEGQENKKVTLTILRNTPQDLDTQFEKEIIAEFEAKHPNVKIDYQQMAYDSYITSLQTKLASGDAPDLYQLEMAYIPKYVENGYATDLSDLDSVKNIDPEDLANMSMDGKLYALATGASSMCVTYNKDAFEKAGITELPKTLDEFAEVCDRLKNAGYEPIANGFKEAWTISGNIQTDYITGVLAQDSGAIKGACDGSKPFSESEIWKEEFQRFFDRYQYSNSDAFGTDWNNACSMLATGKAGMILNGSWAVTNALGVNADANLGIFAMPLSNNPEDAKLLLQGPTGGWAVYKDSKNVELAKEFVNYITSVESVSKNTKMCQSISVVKGAEAGDNPAIQDMQKYIEDGNIFRQGNIDHNFPNEQRDTLEKLLSQYLVNNNLDVDALCKELDEEFARISQ